MIPHSPNRIYLNNSGACNFPFDIDHLHDQLSASLKANGIRHHSIADDIIIALQHVLSKTNFKIRSDADLDQIHAMLIKVLQDNGFAEVADHFAQTMRDSSVNFLMAKINHEFQQIGSTFTKANAQNVLNKLLHLGYPTAELNPLLIREICKLDLEFTNKIQEKVEDDNASEQTILNKEYVDWNWEHLQICTTGSIFVALRIDIFPLKIAQQIDMPIFMEIIFLSYWEKLLNNVTHFLENYLQQLKSKKQKPVDYIKIVFHDQEKFNEFCQIGEKNPFPNELNKTVISAFNAIIKNFSNTKLSTNVKIKKKSRKI